MPKKPNTLRIIGGSLRGRTFQFPNHSELRPTSDRVRETVFNWLMNDIHGARCLDLFSGSGALAFEAISRGASYALLVDNDRDIVHALKNNLQKFNIENADVLQKKIPGDITTQTSFDIIFLDPPFKKGLVEPTCAWLAEKKLVSENTLIYIEAEKKLDLVLPSGWTIFKEKFAGDVCYRLITNSLDNRE